MEYNALAHYGILGMHWGVRRTPEQLGHRPSGGQKPKKRLSADERERARRRAASNKRRTLSTEEIKARIERLKLEKQLKDLTEEDLNPGRKAVKDILAQSGRKVLGTVATGAALYAVKSALSKEFNAKELGSAVFNGGPKKK